ncbi:DUF1294 domain-containing protein [Paenibacillus sp. YK5]|nr:DUF1294 domain-containing protein [Paenibacillus naphthalenovorans]
MELWMIYWITINFVAFFIMGYDKSQAKKGSRRIAEHTLFLIAAAGGALGMWFGMRKWRHKTKHVSFVYGIPLLVVFNAAIAFYFGSA